MEFKTTFLAETTHFFTQLFCLKFFYSFISRINELCVLPIVVCSGKKFPSNSQVNFFWAMTDHNENIKTDIKWNGKQCMNYCASNFLAINIWWEGEKNGPEALFAKILITEKYISLFFCIENVPFMLPFPFFLCCELYHCIEVQK